jgi:GAF domain-containing protein
MDQPEDLRSRIEVVNRVLRSQRTLPAKLEAVTEMLLRVVPGCDSASVALVVEGRVRTGAVSSDLAIEADLIQYREQEGPCLRSVSSAAPVRIDVLRQDEEFVHFAPGAIERGVESVLSIPLLWDRDVVGSLNLYSRSPGAFDSYAESEVDPLAHYAAELIARSPVYAYTLDLMDELAAEVLRRDTVAVALGILMSIGHCDEVEAWQMLQEVPAGDDQSLAERARFVIDTLGAQVPTPDDRPEGGTEER